MNDNTKKKSSLVYKSFHFDLKDVTGYAECVVSGHTDVVIPGGVFSIDMSYSKFHQIYKVYKNEIEKN